MLQINASIAFRIEDYPDGNLIILHNTFNFADFNESQRAHTCQKAEKFGGLEWERNKSNLILNTFCIQV